MLMLTYMINQMLGYAPAAAYALMDSPIVRELGLAGSAPLTACLQGLPEKIETTFESFE